MQLTWRRGALYEQSKHLARRLLWLIMHGASLVEAGAEGQRRPLLERLKYDKNNLIFIKQIIGLHVKSLFGDRAASRRLVKV